MLNNNQIKLIQTAVRAAGLRTKHFDGRYRMLLGQYLQPNGRPVTSCKQLNNSQLEDLLAICEAHGWRMPDKPENFYRFKVATESDIASFAQQSAIKKLGEDLGWNDAQLGGMLKRMTGGFATTVIALSPGQAYKIIECLKAILTRDTGKSYSNLREIQEDMDRVPEAVHGEVVTDGQKSQV